MVLVRFFPQDWRREVAEHGRTPVWVLIAPILLFGLAVATIGLRWLLVFPAISLTLCLWCWAVLQRGSRLNALIVLVPPVGSFSLAIAVWITVPMPPGSLVSSTLWIGLIFSQLLRGHEAIRREQDCQSDPSQSVP